MPQGKSHSFQVGMTFGLTSGIITTLGLVVGLSAGTESQLAVIGGIVTIAVADALSDALGIHVSEEAENIHSSREIWTATVSTFVAKFLMAMTFLVPVVLLNLTSAVVVCVAWGATVLALLSVHLARRRGARVWPVVAEHLGVGALVVVVAHGLGRFVLAAFS